MTAQIVHTSAVPPQQEQLTPPQSDGYIHRRWSSSNTTCRSLLSSLCNNWLWPTSHLNGKGCKRQHHGDASQPPFFAVATPHNIWTYFLSQRPLAPQEEQQPQQSTCSQQQQQQPSTWSQQSVNAADGVDTNTQDGRGAEEEGMMTEVQQQQQRTLEEAAPLQLPGVQGRGFSRFQSLQPDDYDTACEKSFVDIRTGQTMRPFYLDRPLHETPAPKMLRARRRTTVGASHCRRFCSRSLSLTAPRKASESATTFRGLLLSSATSEDTCGDGDGFSVCLTDDTGGESQRECCCRTPPLEGCCGTPSTRVPGFTKDESNSGSTWAGSPPLTPSFYSLTPPCESPCSTSDDDDAAVFVALLRACISLAFGPMQQSDAANSAATPAGNSARAVAAEIERSASDGASSSVYADSSVLAYNVTPRLQHDQRFWTDVTLSAEAMRTTALWPPEHICLLGALALMIRRVMGGRELREFVIQEATDGGDMSNGQCSSWPHTSARREHSVADPNDGGSPSLLLSRWPCTAAYVLGVIDEALAHCHTVLNAENWRGLLVAAAAAQVPMEGLIPFLRMSRPLRRALATLTAILRCRCWADRLGELRAMLFLPELKCDNLFLLPCGGTAASRPPRMSLASLLAAHSPRTGPPRRNAARGKSVHFADVTAQGDWQQQPHAEGSDGGSYNDERVELHGYDNEGGGDHDGTENYDDDDDDDSSEWLQCSSRSTSYESLSSHVRGLAESVLGGTGGRQHVVLHALQGVYVYRVDDFEGFYCLGPVIGSGGEGAVYCCVPQQVMKFAETAAHEVDWDGVMPTPRAAQHRQDADSGGDGGNALCKRDYHHHNNDDSGHDGELEAAARNEDERSVIARITSNAATAASGGAAATAGCKASPRWATKLCSSFSYAVKVTPKSSWRSPLDVYSMAHFTASLKHPLVVGHRAFYEDAFNFYFVMERARGIDLLELVKRQRRIGENEARIYAAQMLLALRYIHGEGLIHRDVKLENFVFCCGSESDFDADDDNDDDHHHHHVHNKWTHHNHYDYSESSNDKDCCCCSEIRRVKLIDFGISIYESDISNSAPDGTPAYSAPELAFQRPPYTYTAKIDIWCVGICLCYMLTGSSPFGDRGVVPLLLLEEEGAEHHHHHGEDHQNNNNHREKWGRFPQYREWMQRAQDLLSDAARDFVLQLLAESPAARPSAATSLGHPWLWPALERCPTDWW